MPIDYGLQDKRFPMQIYWGQKAKPYFLPHLSNIKVKMLQGPSRTQVLSYLPEFVMATWEKDPQIGNYTQKEREDCLRKLFQFKVLPNFMETVGFTFLISNIDLVDVTHLIRHRAMTFSAHCTGDRDQRFDTALVKQSIIDSDFLDRYSRLVNQAFNLYADMVDSRDISILDARTILPRCTANHYYAKVNLKDLLAFLRQRLDKQIQPESDNIIALKILVEVAKILPEIRLQIDLDAPDHFYIKTAQTDHSSNLYQPEEKNDIFNWKPQWFLYNCKREEMPGGQEFKAIWDDLANEYMGLTDHVMA